MDCFGHFVTILRRTSLYFQRKGLADLAERRMYFISLRERSATEVKTPRAMTSRSILASQISTY